MADIEYFYAAHSAFAYLGSAKLTQIAERGGHQIVHKPIDLRKVVDAAGSQSLRSRSAAHRAYFFGVEIKRWAKERDAPVMDGTPTHHRNDITLPNCFLIAGQELELDIGSLAHALLSSHWLHDADLADPETLVRIADVSGYPGAEILKAARERSVKSRYQANTDEAIARSVFGSPTYFLGDEMFYGQDRLELLEKALTPLAVEEESA